MVLRGLDVILRSFGGHFCGAHVGTASPFLALLLQEFNSINQYHSILPRSKYFQPQKKTMFFLLHGKKEMQFG